jgi:hypothetical protein
MRITLRGTDEDGDKLEYALLERPAHGTADKLDPPTGAVTYAPAKDFVGTDAFTFKVTDSSGLDSNRATVHIRVKDGAAGSAAEDEADAEDLLKP